MSGHTPFSEIKHKADEDPYIVSVHKFRRAARKREREIQHSLDVVGTYDPNKTVVSLEKAALHEANVPSWAKGVKVVRAGLFQHALVATRNRGH